MKVGLKMDINTYLGIYNVVSALCLSPLDSVTLIISGNDIFNKNIGVKSICKSYAWDPKSNYSLLHFTCPHREKKAKLPRAPFLYN